LLPLADGHDAQLVREQVVLGRAAVLQDHGRVVVVGAALQLVALVQLQDPRLPRAVARLDHGVDVGALAVVLVFMGKPRQLLVVLGRRLAWRLRPGRQRERAQEEGGQRQQESGGQVLPATLPHGWSPRGGTYVGGSQVNTVQAWPDDAGWPTRSQPRRRVRCPCNVPSRRRASTNGCPISISSMAVLARATFAARMPAV